MAAKSEKLLSVKDALARLNISRTTLWRLVKNREIDCIRLGKHVRFEREHIETFIKKNTVAAKK